jgi:hypothetical protein
MTITKNTKIIIGVALLGTAGYLYWKSTQAPAVINCTAPKVLNDAKTACVDAPVAAPSATA